MTTKFTSILKEFLSYSPYLKKSRLAVLAILLLFSFSRAYAQCDPALVLAGSTVCSKQDGNITITAAESSITYEVLLAGVSLSPAVTGVGTGADLVLTIPEAQMIPGTTTYTIEATGTACTAVLTDSVDVTERTGLDSDGDGIVNDCDLDDDNDGILDSVECQLIETNIALSGAATQSSTYSGGTPDRAIDGNTNGVFTSGSVTHTNGETNPFWEVSFATSVISTVNVFNRTDCCGSRLDNFVMEILDLGNVVFTYTHGSAGASINIPVSNVIGDQVRIRLVGSSIILSLAEVQVIALEQLDTDTDGDGIDDHLDLDSDNDGIYDLVESGADPSLDANLDGTIDAMDTPATGDTDNDGLADSIETTNGADTGTTPRETTVGTPDYINLDSDDDGCSDAAEAYSDFDIDGSDGGIYNPANATAEPYTVGAGIDADGSVTAAAYTAPKDANNNSVADYIENSYTFCDCYNPSLPDFDNDGVSNFCDLDDDNDGILDVDERQCQIGFFEDFGFGGETSSSYVTGYSYNPGSTLTGGQYTIARRPNPDAGTWSDWSTWGDHTGGGRMLVVNADASPGIFYRRQINNLQPGLTVTFGIYARNILISGTNKVLPRVNIRIYDSSNTIVYTGTTGFLNEGAGWTYRTATIPNLNNPFYTLELYSGSSGTSGNDLVIDDISFYQQACETDGDGFFDYHELDSDNDGIYDIVEAGNNAVIALDADNNGIIDNAEFNDINSNGLSDEIEALLGANTGVTPLNTAAGLPNFQNLDSDADGCSDSVEAGNTLVTNNDIINFNTGADANNDGMLDEFVDIATGNINYTSTEYFAYDAALNACLDSDGDGVGDLADLDDDNDGILDSDECASNAPSLINSGFENITGLSNGETVGADISPWTITSGSSNVIKVDGAGPYNYGSGGPEIDARGGAGQYLDITLGSGDFYQSFTLSNDALITYSGYFSSRETNTGTAAIRIYSGVGVGGTIVSSTPTITVNNNSTWTQIEKTVFLYAGTYSFVVSMNENMNFDEGALTASGCFSNINSDTDSDGTPDYLDLDSDNDGCSDADEAYTDTTADNDDGGIYGSDTPLPTVVNGLVNNNGLVISAVLVDIGAAGSDDDEAYTTTPAITIGGENTFQQAVELATTAPVDDAACVDGTAEFKSTLTVTATPATTPATVVGTTTSDQINYVWQVSTDGGTTFTDITAAGTAPAYADFTGTATTGTEVTLGLSNVPLSADDYQYQVAITHEANICPVESLPANLTVNENPVATTNNVAVCKGVTSATIAVTATTGTPINYTIDYDAAAETAGFADVTAATITGASYVIPAAAAAAVYNGTLSYIDANGCSGTDAFTVTVNENPVATTNNVAVCKGVTSATIAVTATTGTPINYTIDYDAAAETAGFADVTAATITGASYVIPAAAAAAVYNGTLSYIDANGCSGTDAFTVTVNENPVATTNNVAVCKGVTSATIAVTATTGTPINYTIDYDAAAEAEGFADVSTAATITGASYVIPAAAAAAVYNGTLSYIDANGCSGTDAFTVTVNENPVATTNNVAVCKGVTSATIAVTATTGTPINYTIDYDAAAEAEGFADVTTATITGASYVIPAAAAAAVYNGTLSYIDANGCSGTDAFTVTVNENPVATTNNVAVCKGVTSATIAVTATTGTPINYTIDYDAAAEIAGFADVTTATITGASYVIPAAAAAAVYNGTLSYIDANGCSGTDAFTVTVNENPVATTNNVAVCKGVTSATIAVTATTGTPINYTIDYDAAAEIAGFADVTTAATITGASYVIPAAAAAAVYNGTLSYIDANGCSGTDAFTVTVNENPVATTNNVAVCKGVTSATLTVTATTGTPINYTIDYDAAAEAEGFADVTTATITGASYVIPAAAAAAVYNGTLSYIDANGCSGTDAFTVTVNENPVATTNNVAVCKGVTSATIAVTATTGTPINYTIDYDAAAEAEGFADVTTASTITGASYVIPAAAAAAVYNGTLSYIDANGCSGTDAFTVTVNENPVATTNNVAVCKGVTSATIAVTATTGTPINYTIDYDAAAETAGFSDVSTAATITGASYVIPAAAAAAVYNGTLSYIDANGCSGTDAFTVTVNENPVATTNNVAVCKGVTSATIAVTATTGTPINYTIDYDAAAEAEGFADVSTAATITGASYVIPAAAAAAVYNGTLSYIDANGCSGTDAFTVTVNENPVATTNNVAVCKGVTSATIAVTATTGTPINYTIDYDAAAEAEGFADVTTATITGASYVIPAAAAAAVYNGTLSYIDANGCSGTDAFTVTVNENPVATTNNVAVCKGVTSATIAVTATTGTPINYTIDYDAAAEAEGFADVTTATITGASYVIPAAAAAAVYNGTLSYIDANGCSGTDAFTVTVNENPVATTNNVAVCKGVTSATIAVTATTGTPINYTIDYDAAAEIAGFADVTTAATITGASYVIPAAAAAAVYNGTLSYIDANGCSGTDAFTVTVNENPVATTNNVAVCKGVTSATIAVTATTGTPINYTIDYDAAAEAEGFADVTTATITGASYVIPAAAAAAVYNGTLSYIDANGCSGTDAFTVTVNENPVATTNNVAVCKGVTSATLTVTATTGTPINYTIDYDAAAEAEGFADVTTATITGASYVIPAAAAAAVYNGTLSYIDANGCSGTDAFTVTVNENPVATTNNVAVCKGVTSATIAVTATTGTPINYTIDYDAAAETAGFSDVSTAATITGASYVIPAAAAAAVYNGTLSYIDANGCSGTDAFTVTVNENPVATTNNVAVCKGVTSATIAVTATTGTPINYTIDYDAAAEIAGFADVTTATITGASYVIPAAAAAAVYNGTLSYIDANGCSGTDAFTVTVNENPVATTNNVAVCKGVTSATIAVTATTGTPINYTIDYDAAAEAEGFADVTTATITGASYVIPAAAAAAVYNGTLSYIDANGCSGTDAFTVTVNENPVATTNNVAVCKGVTSATIAVTATTGTPINYTIDYDTAAEAEGFADVTTAVTITGASYVIPAAAAAAVYNGTLSYIDANGCSGTDAFTVTVNENPVATTNNVAVCKGVTSATIAVTATTGTPINYTIDYDAAAEAEGFSDVSTAATITGASYVIPAAAAAAVYNGTLSYIDANGCSGTDAFTVTVNENPVATTNNVAVCKGVTSATIAVTATTGTPINYTIDYDAAAEAAGFADVSTAATITGASYVIPAAAAAAVYNGTLSYIDSNGCSGTDAFTVTVNENPVATTNNVAVCKGVTSATIAVTATTGTPINYTIDYDTAAEAEGFADVTTATLTGASYVIPAAAAAAVYNGTLSYIDANGCSGTDAFTVTVNENPVATTNNVAVCKGVTSATIAVTATTGTPINYTIDYDAAAEAEGFADVTTAVTITGASYVIPAAAAAAVYNGTLTYIDANGCSGTDAFTVTVNENPVATTNNVAVCKGVTSATIAVTATTGTPINYTIDYDAAAEIAGFADVTTATITGASYVIPAAAAAAVYNGTLSYIDANGCSGTDAFTVTVNENPVATTNNVAVCKGVTSATIAVTATTGTPINYTIDYDAAAEIAGFADVTTAATLTGASYVIPAAAAAAVYNGTLSYIDANGCSGTDAFTVTVNENPVATTNNVAVCKGVTSATIAVTATTGTPINYTIDYDAAAEAAGFADVTTASTITGASYVIPAAAAAAVYNGTLSYIDANGCSGTDAFTVTVNENPVATTNNVAVCKGVTSATIAVTATTGTPINYTIDYDAAAEIAGFADVTTATITGASYVIPAAAAAAVYNGTLSYIDANGCSGTDAFTVTVNENPVATTNNVAVCKGVTSATIAVTATTGTPINYTIDYDAAAEAEGFADVTTAVTLTGASYVIPAAAAAAVYNGTLSYIDANGCSGTDAFTVTVNENPVATTNNVAVCKGVTSATIAVTATTGTPINYTIDYDAAAETAGFSDVSTAATITGASYVIPAAAAAAVYNGTLSYIDANGCSGTDAFTVTVNENPVATTNNVAVCKGVTSATIAVTATTGTPINYTIDYDAAAEIAGFSDVSTAATITGASYVIPAAAAAAVYNGTLSYIDANGCSGTDAFTVTVNENPVATTNNVAVCKGVTSATIAVTATTGTPINYTIDYDAAAEAAGFADVTTATITGASYVIPAAAAAAVYNGTLSYIDANGCSGTDAFTVTVNENPVATTNNVAVCKGVTSATIAVTATTGTPINYTIDYDAAAEAAGFADVTTATITGASYVIPAAAAAAVYNGTLSYIDANGCSGTDAFTVTVNENPVATTNNVAVCKGVTSATIAVTATTGTPINYTIDYDAAAEAEGFADVTTATITGASYVIPAAAAAAVYNGTLSYIDANGCSGTDAFTVTVNENPVATTNNVAVCKGVTSATIAVTATTGTPINYTIDYDAAAEAEGFADVTTATITGASYVIPAAAAAAVYNGTLSYIDANGCSGTDAFTVTVNENPVATTNNVAVCKGVTSATIAVTATTGTPINYTIDYDAAAEAEGFSDVTTASTITGASYVIPAAAAAAVYNGTLSYIDANGCSGTDAFTVTVNENPVATTNNVAVCKGVTSATIAVTATTGTPINYTIDYDAAAEAEGFADVTTATITGASYVIPAAAAAAVYNGTLSYIDANGCSGTDAFTVTVNENPVATTNNVAVCKGVTSATIAVTATTGTPINYTIDYDAAAEAEGFADVTTATITGASYVIPAAAAAAVYNGTLSYIDANGCSGTDAFTVTVNENPVATTNNVAVCKGVTSATIAVTATTGTPINYTIDYDAAAEAEGFADVTTATITGASYVIPAAAAAAVYNGTLSYIDANGCSGTDAFTVTVNENPVATTNNVAVCKGVTSATLTVTATTGTPINYTIDYDAAAEAAGFADVSTAATITGASYVIPAAAAAAVYNGTLSYIDANGCSGTDAFTVTVKPVPILALTSATNPTNCTPGNNGKIVLSTTDLPDGSYTINYEDASAVAQTTTMVVVSNVGTISNLTVGTYNNIKVTNLSCTSVADINVVLKCVEIDLVKTVSTAPTDNGDGTFTVGYTVTATNSGSVAGMYDIVEDFNPGTGITFTSGTLAYGAEADGTNGTTAAVADGATIVDNEGLSSGATESWTITAIFTVDPTAITAAGSDCDTTNDGGAGTGFANSISGSSTDTDTTDDVACAGLPIIDLVKTVSTAPTDNGDGTFTVGYTVTATNSGSVAGVYDIVEDFNPGTGITFTSGTLAYGAEADGTNGTTAAVADGATIVDNEGLAAGATESWTITAIFTVDPTAITAAGSDCDTTNDGGAGTGFANSISGSSTDTDTTDDVACAGLTIIDLVKTVSTAPTDNGDGTFTVGYTVTATNSGSVAGVYDIVEDFNPGTGITFTSGTLAYGAEADGTNGTTAAVADGATIVDNEGLAAGATESWTITAIFTVDPTAITAAGSDCDTTNDGGAGTGFANSISGSSTDTDTTDNSACAGLPIIDLVKTVSGGPTDNGDGTFTVGYTVTATNSGSVAGVYDIVEDFNPGTGITFTSGTLAYGAEADGTNGTTAAVADGATIVDNEGLAAGATESWTITAIFTVDPTAITAAGSDCDTTNDGGAGTGFANSISGSSTDTDTTDDVACAGLPIIDLVKTVSGGPTDNGDGTFTVAYTVTATNSGSVAGVYDIVEDFNPGTGITFTSGTLAYGAEADGTNGTTAAVADGATIVDNEGLSSGATESWTITAIFTVDPTAITAAGSDCDTTNDGGAGTGFANSISGSSTDTDTTDDVACAALLLPSIAITKEGTYVDGNGDGITNIGDRITYTFTVKNTGNVILTDITVTDPDAAMSGGPLASLAVGATDTTTFTGAHTLSQADIDSGNVYNLATATGTPPTGVPVTGTSKDPTPCASCPIDPACTDCTITPLAQNPSIGLLKTSSIADTNADGIVGNLGDTIIYVFTIENTGNVTLSGVTISDPLPNIMFNGGPIASLAPGAIDTTTFTASYVITQADIDAGEVFNQATVSGEVPGGDPADPTDDITDTSDDPNDPTDDDGDPTDPTDDDGEPDDPTVTPLLAQDPCAVSGPIDEADLLNLIFANADCDGDGVTNGEEIDPDGDGRPGGTGPEGELSTNWNDPCDYNEDDITLLQTSGWSLADCDGDGTPNGEELPGEEFDPCKDDGTTGDEDLSSPIFANSDCDGDGVTNGTEITDGTDPSDPCDFVADSVSLEPSGEFLTSDCDRDRIPNGQEITEGTDMFDPCSGFGGTPPNGVVCDIEIVNELITPDGDGVNDVFRIRYIESYPVNSVEIFNRWGVKVFTAEGYDNDTNAFRGISNGRVTVKQDEGLPAGVYFFIINYKDEGYIKSKSGYLYINQ